MADTQELVEQGLYKIEEEIFEQYLTFILAGEEFAIDILRVQEIKSWDRATGLPGSPNYVEGVINLRGTIVPIIDLRKRFKLPDIEFGCMTDNIMVFTN